MLTISESMAEISSAMNRMIESTMKACLSIGKALEGVRPSLEVLDEVSESDLWETKPAVKLPPIKMSAGTHDSPGVFDVRYSASIQKYLDDNRR